MAGKKRTGKSIAIVTFPGEDGASAAALLLTAKPKAKVFLSSKSGISRVLSALSKTSWKEVHICGVGILQERIGEVVEALRRLNAKGAVMTWYSGYDYLNEFIPILEPVNAGAKVRRVAGQKCST